MDATTRNSLVGLSLDLYKKPRLIIEADLTAIYLVLSGKADFSNLHEKLASELSIKPLTLERAVRFAEKFMKTLASEETKKQVSEAKQKAVQEGLQNARENASKVQVPDEEVQ